MNAVTKEPTRYVETAVEDETLLMVLDTGDFFTLRDTARAVWNTIDGTRDRNAIVAALADQYAVPEQDIATEIDAFLAELTEVGLVRRA